MKEYRGTKQGQACDDPFERIEFLVRRNPQAWQSVGAVVGLAGGIVAPVLGTLLTVVRWFISMQRASYLNRLSIILFALTIPLLAFGAHCLDLLEAKTAPLSPPEEHPAVGVASVSARVARSNGRRRLNKTGMPAVLILLLSLPASSDAQQTISSVPVTDVLPPREGCVEPGVSAKLTGPETRPNPSPSPPGYESLRRAKPAPFYGALLPAGYSIPASEPVIAVRDSAPVRPPAKGVLDGANAQETTSQESQPQQSDPQWQYGGFVDLAYLLDFNHPANRLFRGRGTAFHVDELDLNMAGFYVRKKATEQSRWGVELTAQAGKDTEVFGFSATAPNVGGHRFLRHLGPTNVSYLAPVGRGLTLQAGIFSSFIGYDSLYAKDNLNYTRPWGADFTPYLMMGANASYHFSEKLTGTFFVVNGYWHLARANNVPSWGGQVGYKANPRWTVKQTVLVGPHQSNTVFKFWRFLSDTIVERRTGRAVFAFDSNFSTERVTTPAGHRAWWFAAQLPARLIINEWWSLSARPEVAWDSEGRWTLARQTVKAFTSTLEYRLPYRSSNTIFRLEHRWDDSRGREGGFFRGREVRLGVIGLTPSQHLLVFATIFTFDR